jgi:PelA/Pel-15E family pectate lyase
MSDHMNPLRLFLLASFCLPIVASAAEPPLREQAIAGMKRAAEFYRAKASAHGGYVYYTSLDLQQRWGEGKATPDQIFIQPPGTPAVGMALLKAHAATGDKFYLAAAQAAAEALVFGQLESGGWAQVIDFDPRGAKAGQYRNGKARGRNYSTFDDGISQSALRFLMQADQALGFKHAAIHEASEFARKSVLAAQHPTGAFPQGWTGPAPQYPPVKASFPDYEWRTENRVKNYWDFPTLNDDLCTYIARTLEDGWMIYKDERCKAALAKLGDFLLLAQMPEPQPGWAQQYDFKTRPIWARKFEPPALAGRESQDAIETLLQVHRVTGDAKYLEPIPRTLAWLKRSRLPDGRLARYYELRTNKPLYMTSDYQLTNSDADVPQHYGWKNEAHIEQLEKALAAAKSGTAKAPQPKAPTEAQVRQILRDLDAQGRWVSTYAEGMKLVGQPKFATGFQFLASEVFNKNVEALSDYLSATAKQ